MAQENPVPQEGKKKGGNNFLLMIIIVVVVTLVVSAGTSFLIITLLGQNVQKTADATPSAGTTGLVVQAEMIREGARYPVMLKGGKDVAIVDALYYKVGSEECRSSIGTNKLEILDAVRTIFLNKTSSEVTNPTGQELIKKQIKDAVNEITGYTGEREKIGVLSVILIILTISQNQ
jgi:flagellar FliL protein